MAGRLDRIQIPSGILYAENGRFLGRVFISVLTKCSRPRAAPAVILVQSGERVGAQRQIRPTPRSGAKRACASRLRQRLS